MCQCDRHRSPRSPSTSKCSWQEWAVLRYRDPWDHYEKKTAAVQSDGQAVRWNETLGTFVVYPSSHPMLCIYAKSTEKDILTGKLEMRFGSFHSLFQSKPTIYLKISVSVDSTTAKISDHLTESHEVQIPKDFNGPPSNYSQSIRQ